MEGRPAADSLSGKERSCARCSLEVGRHLRLTTGCESAECFSGLARCRPAECAEEVVRGETSRVVGSELLRGVSLLRG